MGYGQVAPAPLMFCPSAQAVRKTKPTAAITFKFPLYPPREMHRSMQSVNTSLIEFEGELLRGGYTGVKTALFDGRRLFGEGEKEVSAGVELIFGANGAAVRLAHVTCDRQTETSAAGRPRAGV